MIKIGNNNLSTIKLGSTQVNKVYVGSNVVWENITYGGLCLKAVNPGAKVQLNKNYSDVAFQYSRDGKTWNEYNFEAITLTNKGDRVYFAATDAGNETMFNQDEFTGCQIGTSDLVEASGNLMSLIDNTLQRTSIPYGSFNGLFYGSKITTIPYMPFDFSSDEVYNKTFGQCSELKKVDEILIGSNLESFMYYMCAFSNSGLISAPTVKFISQPLYFEGWYMSSMFLGCPFTDPVVFDLTNCTSVPGLSRTHFFEQIEKDYRIKVPESLYNDFISDICWSNIADKIIT